MGYMSAETREYVPKIMAMILIDRNRVKYGFPAEHKTAAAPLKAPIPNAQPPKAAAPVKTQPAKVQSPKALPKKAAASAKVGA
jgi:hypothetical protein